MRSPDKVSVAASKSTTKKLTGGYKITFSSPQLAVTPGQSAVIYKGEDCLGSVIKDRIDFIAGLIIEVIITKSMDDSQLRNCPPRWKISR